MRIEQSESKQLWFAIDGNNKIVKVFINKDLASKYIESK